MSALASLGAFVLPLLKMIPGIGPRLQMAAYGLLGLAVSHVAVAGWVWLKMHEANAVEMAKAEAQWRLALQAEKDVYDRKVAEVVAHAMQEPPTPADAAQRRVLCRKSPTCRDGR